MPPPSDRTAGCPFTSPALPLLSVSIPFLRGSVFAGSHPRKETRLELNDECSRSALPEPAMTFRDLLPPTPCDLIRMFRSLRPRFDSHRLCNLKSCCLMSLKKIITKKRKGCQRSAAPVRKKKELYCNNVMINEACTRMDKGIKFFHAANLFTAQEVGI